MACTRYEAAANIRVEAARLEALADKLGEDHSGTCTELDQSKLAFWVGAWLEAAEKDAGTDLQSKEVLWVPAVRRTCTRLVEATVAGRKPGGIDVERIRLFVNDLVRGQMLPCVAFAARAMGLEAGRGAAGAGAFAGGDGATSQSGRLFSELMGCFRAIGTSSARFIANPRGAQSKGMNKLANTTWTAVYDGFRGQSEGLRDREGMACCLGNLVEMIECCFASMADGNASQVGCTASSKALKFLVSNYGRLVVLLGGTGGGTGDGTGGERGTLDASRGTWEMIQPSVCSLWRCLVRHAAVPTERDPFHGAALTYKAVALSFEHALEAAEASEATEIVHAANAADPMPWSIFDGGQVSPNVLHVVANLMIVASEKMSRKVLEKMCTTVGQLMGHLADAGVQQGMTESILGDVEVGILEYLSRCLDADPNVFKRALYTLMAYLLRPHPLVEEILCRVLMGLMEWGSEGLQYECVAMISDMLNRAVSCDDDLGLCPGVEQGVNVLAAAMLVGGDSLAMRIAEGQFPSRPEGGPPGPGTAHKSQTATGTVDVFEVARLAVFMRAIGYCSWSPSFSKGTSRESWLRGQLNRVATMWRMRPVGDDSALLTAWTAECLFHASKLVTSGPLLARPEMNGVGNPRAKCATDDGTTGTALRVATECVACRLVLSSSPSCPRLQRAAVLLDAIQKHVPSTKRACIHGLDAALDTFDAALPTAGWLVGLAAVQKQRPSSRMRRVYGNSLDRSATLPLQYLAMHSYKDYVSFSDSDESYGVEAGGDQALDVLPSCRIVGGSISSEFKARLTPYLVGLEYGNGIGDGSADPKLGPALASAARALEDGFRRNDCSKRAHRQIPDAGQRIGPSQELRGIATALRGWSDGWSGQHGGSEEEIAEVVRQMQLDLDTIIRTLSL